MHSESDESAARFVKAHWKPDILWYGPGGIGSTGLTVARYKRQHQLPFRQNLYDKAGLFSNMCHISDLGISPRCLM